MSNLENDRDDNSGFDLDHISSTRISNVAKAYGWWVAKDSLSLTILKVSGCESIIQYTTLS